MNFPGRLAVLSSLNKTTFGAVFSSILVVLFLIGKYFPVLGIAAVFFCPIPVTLMHVQFKDIKFTMLVLLVSTALIGAFAGPVSAFIFLTGMGMQGLAFGITVANGRSAFYSVFFCAVVSVLMTIFLYYAATSLVDMDLSMKQTGEMLKKAMSEYKTSTIESLRKSGASDEQVRQVETMYNQNMELLKNIHVFVPFFLFASTLMTAFINYKVTSLIFKKLKIDINGFPRFELWRISWGYLWGFIAGLLLVNLFLANSPNPAARYLNIAGQNILLTFNFIFFASGLAVLHYFLVKYSVPVAMKIFLYVMIILNPLLYTFVVIAGLMDPWFDLRGLEKKECESNNNGDCHGSDDDNEGGSDK